MDTGPAVKGRLIDIYMWICYEALDFGRMPIDLTVLRLGWNPQATTPSFFARIFKRSAATPPPLPSRPLPQALPAETLIPEQTVVPDPTVLEPQPDTEAHAPLE